MRERERKRKKNKKKKRKKSEHPKHENSLSFLRRQRGVLLFLNFSFLFILFSVTERYLYPILKERARIVWYDDYMRDCSPLFYSVVVVVIIMSQSTPQHLLSKV